MSAADLSMAMTALRHDARRARILADLKPIPSTGAPAAPPSPVRPFAVRDNDTHALPSLKPAIKLAQRTGD